MNDHFIMNKTETNSWFLGHNNLVMMKMNDEDNKQVIFYRVPCTNNKKPIDNFVSDMKSGDLQLLTVVKQDLKFPESKKSVEMIFNNAKKLSVVKS